MSVWRTMATAPRDGTWFLALRAGTMIGAGNPPRAIPSLEVMHRAQTSPTSDGYWSNSHGNSIADGYIRGALWAPLDALPLAELYASALSRGDTPFPLSNGEGDRWVDFASRRYRAIGAQEMSPIDEARPQA